MTVRQNDTTALAATGDQTDKVYIQGDGNFIISGTWAGTVTFLKRRALWKSIGVQDGGDAQAAFTDSTLTKATGTAIVADELIGMWISNDDTGSVGPITDNTATVVTATQIGGTDQTWDDDETASLWQVVGAYTTNQNLTFNEADNRTDFMAVFVKSSGTAHIEISQ